MAVFMDLPLFGLMLLSARAARAPELTINDGQPTARICQASWHTYVNLGDGGCFQHLLEDGHFKADHQDVYASKFCPFARPDLHWRRALLLRWYERTKKSRTFSPGDVAFTLQDMAMTCLLGKAEELPDNFLPNVDADTTITRTDFCDTMLSLPLMFEAIGFDVLGLVMQEGDNYLVTSFKGTIVKNFKLRRPGPDTGCVDSAKQNLGESKLARLALRAVVPTYFVHVHAQSGKGVLVKGTRAVFAATKFKPKYWSSAMSKVCSAADSPESLDKLFSLASLRGRGLLSEKALKRDAGKCSEVLACNYGSNASEHLDACDVCDDKYPWFDGIECFDSDDGSGRMSRCEDAGQRAKKSCKCSKAICWYFTSDFRAAFDVATELCSRV